MISAVERARSTSVGDVVMTDDGKAFLCDHVGWKEVRVKTCKFENSCDLYGSAKCNLVNPENALTESDCGF